MSDDFFRDPVLNSPYEPPTHHRELDEDRQPTTGRRAGRGPVSFVTPIPKPRKRGAGQGRLELAETTTAVREDDQKYEPAQIIDSVRQAVNGWRAGQSHLNQRVYFGCGLIHAMCSRVYQESRYGRVCSYI